MKTFKVALVASALLVNVNADQAINLKTGWNLVGTYVDNVSVDKFKNANIVWKLSNGKWVAYSSDSNIQKLIDQKKFSTFNTINSGEGFWVNTTSSSTVTIAGDATKDTLNIKKGWNLLSLTSDKSVSVDFFKDAVVIWKWDNAKQKWAVYSPKAKLQSQIAALVKSGSLETFNIIEPGEGFWVYSGEANTMDLQTPPSIGFAYEMLNKLNAIPLANADVYVNGNKIATTDNTGKFLLDNVADGSAVTIKKNGYAVAYGVVKNGKVVIITQKDNNEKVKFSATEGAQKVAKKGITAQDGTVSIIASSAKLNKDITVSVIPFKSAANAPALNDITVDNTNVPVDQMAIIGGALINVEDSSGNLLTPNEIDGTISFNLAQTTILGDLDTILNGGDSGTAQQFAEKAFTKFNEMMNNGMINILVLQFENGKWVYKGKGKLASYDKLVKKPDGTTSTFTKYKLESNVVLDKLEPTAFVLKMNYLTGEATICTKEAGYKMFDGSVVKSDDSNSGIFEWINESIPNVTVIGDESVTNPAELTETNGCVNVSYKVPFLSPTFNLALKKDGYYDTEVSCSVDAKGATCSDAKMYKIPDTASIEGYVRDKNTQDGINDSLVTLVNPEVLSADKIKAGEDNKTAYVEVGYMPNVEYTWTAVKYDDNATEVVNKVIKTGKGDAKYAKLTEKEIYDVLVKPFNNSSNDFDAKYLTGNWELRVKAVHTFTNTDQTMTEEAIGKFNIDLLMTKLSSFMSGQLSEKKVFVDENGNPVETSLKTSSVYGGFSLGILYEYGAQNDKFEWETSLIADASDANGSANGAICNDYNTTSVSKCEYDPIASKVGISYVNIAKGDVLKYDKSLYPVGLNVKFMAQHFADLLNPDPACYNDTSCKDDPFLISGFTIRTIFKGEIENYPTKDENNDTKLITLHQYLGSYADVGGVQNVSDVLDTDTITLVGSSATAYMRQVITKDSGYYRINMIPPKLSGGLEIFAKAEGYKFDSNADIKLVNDLEVGKVSTYDLYLKPIDSSVKPVLPVTSFSDWNLTSECSVEDVKWQVVTNPLDIKISNTDWASSVWGEENVSLLPDMNTSTNGYVWFGDKNTGMFSDKSNTSSSAVCGKAITPVIDLTNYSFPVLTFNSWFEVESVDVAKYQYDQLNVGFIIPSSENDGKAEVTVYNSNGDAITVKTDTYYPLDKLNPEYEPSVQNANVPYSSAGVGVMPVWKTYQVPADGLAGYKVKFVFDFNSMDSLFNGFRGWGIDNVKVTNSMDDVLSLPPMVPEFPVSTSAADKKIR